ncbi:hypothetical protein [Marinomonas transparens]|uniref:Uncharacterized protein n=1 Tax=Marinomonas transparens TaxID=2795388 RepID=A0A934N127_9GAMM|nr:hypothetical protein [Marinomonas transparens]MBJ7536258.1 hypothetical protein [Marinomonas transparens]
MRVLLLLIFASLLTACSNTQLNVVDSLTASAQNDGVGMTPSKWIVRGHPLQTTYVSLNGQLGLRVGQVCVASSFRSPFTANCLNELGYSPNENKDSYIDHQGKLYQEYYSSNAIKEEPTATLHNFIKAVNDEKTKSAAFVKANTDYLTCLINNSSDSNTDEISEALKKQALNACAAQNTAKDQALSSLKQVRLQVEALAIAPNRMVYNWAESSQLKSGVVVQSESNSANVNSEKKASGYTVVNGLIIERYQMSCAELHTLKQREDAKRLKIVTMTLAAEELYYNANEDASLSLGAAFSFTKDELKMLTRLLDKNGEELKFDLEATINTSSSIASKGYLTAPVITLNNYKKMLIPSKGNDTQTSIKPGLTYYAVLSDIDTLACD